MKQTPALITLVSVNVSLPKDVVTSHGVLRTGIFKEPVRGPVMARSWRREFEERLAQARESAVR